MHLLLPVLLAAWQTIPLPFTLSNGEETRKRLPATMPGGIAVFDSDGDGVLDLFFPNGAKLPAGTKYPNRLLRNLGKLRFEDRTVAAGLSGSGYDFAAAAGDYDADGRVDLLVCGLRGVTLYRNEGGVFKDVTQPSRIDNRGRWAVGAAWLDYDTDGALDLFIVNYVKWDPANEPECTVDGKPDFCHPRHFEPESNALFHNNGDGTFTDVSEASGIAAHKGKGMAAAVADFDLDGRPDVFVTNDRVFNFYFHNLGGGRFAEQAFERGVAAPASGNPPSSMGADAQDYDGDGRPDLVYTALRDETFPLYRNLGAEFAETTLKTRLALLTRPMSGWGIVFADLDNDGWSDLAVARSDALSASGPRGESAREPLSWFRNLEGKQFTDGGSLGAAREMFRGLVAVDLDVDGCLDLVATALNAQARVLRNPCPGNWLRITPPASGARVRVDGQWRQDSSAVGYGSSCACPMHFGLGTRTTADVEVFWPGGGSKRMSGVKANQTLVVAAAVAQDAGDYSRRGADAMRAGRYEQAAEIYRLLARLEPNQPMWRMNLGLALYSAQRYGEAIPELDAFLKAQPAPGPAHLIAGVARLKSKQACDAVPLLESARKWNNDRSVVELADALSGCGRHDQAARTYESALGTTRKSPVVARLAGRSYWLARKYPDAKRHLEPLAADLTRDAGFNFEFGDTLARLEGPEAGLPYLRRAVELNPGLLPARGELGKALVEVSDPEGAIPHLEAAQTVDPSVLLALSRAYQAVGRKPDADRARDAYKQRLGSGAPR